MKANQKIGKKRVVQIDSGRNFPGLKGKVVKWIEIGKGEDPIPNIGCVFLQAPCRNLKYKHSQEVGNIWEQLAPKTA